MPTITFVETESWENDILRELLPNHDLRFLPAHLQDLDAAALDGTEVLSTFIYSTVDEAALAKLPRLRFVTTRSTGFDHLDLAALKARGIAAANVPTYGENTVAEHAFALLLALTRKIIPSVERTRQGDFRLDGLRGVDLAGRTLGVVGTGHIGQHAIRMGLGFGMTVIAADPRQDAALAAKLGFRYVTLDELLATSDAITLHCPYVKATHHLINAENITRVKPGAYLINTARGGLIETQAIVWALEQKRLAGVGLDVLEEEGEIREERQLLSAAFTAECDLRTVLAEHILLEQENVIITPHNAFNSVEALRRILATTAENITAFLAGKPQNLVG